MSGAFRPGRQPEMPSLLRRQVPAGGRAGSARVGPGAGRWRASAGRRRVAAGSLHIGEGGVGRRACERRWAVAEQPGLSFAGLLRQLRTEAELTQEELAEAATLSSRSVSDLERGINRTARKDTAVLVAGALGPGSERWPRRVIRPAGSPLRELAMSLAEMAGTDPVSVYRSLSAAPGEAPMLAELAVRTAAGRGPDTGPSAPADAAAAV